MQLALEEQPVRKTRRPPQRVVELVDLGDYLLKGAMAWEQTTPTFDAEFYVLQDLGWQALEAEEL